jgi:hypothetical protein
LRAFGDSIISSSAAFHAGEQRQLAVLVEVDADAEVHLRRIGVGVELLVESEDRVAGRQLDGGEEGGHGFPVSEVGSDFR